MRLRLPLVASVVLGLLAACDSESDSGPGPYLELVGSTRFLSASRVASSPGDTLTTRLYAAVADGDYLQHLRITTTYSPNLNPISYSSNYDPKAAAEQRQELVYFDSTLTAQQLTKELAFQFTFGARTTSGHELWQFEAEDNQKRIGSRSYRLTLRNADSALVYHRYTARLQAPRTSASRSFLALLPGLTLPKYTIRNNPGAQQLIDLIYHPTAAGEPALSSPDTSVVKLRGANWSTKRITELRITAPIDSTSFGDANNAAAFTSIYNRGTTPTTSTSTGALRRRQIIAFQTADKKYGLIRVESIKTTPVPTLDLQIRIAK